jgi:pantoate--beta-alanine ligase
MELIKHISEMRDYVNRIEKGRSIGFVPTMGYLHAGHLSLIKRARQDCDKVAVSIFVNPIQFSVGGDYHRYPRDLSRDVRLCKQEGVDVAFAPSRDEMYPEGYSAFVKVEGEISSVLEGSSRPGHFQGVCTILTKLFNIINPDFSYFGQKDYQQALVVKRLVRDLNLRTQIVVLPTVREKDGLAVSSRNSYLNKEERCAAAVLHKSLEKAKRLIKEGMRDPALIESKMKDLIKAEPLAQIDYVAVVDLETLRKVERIEKEILVVVAVKIGGTRLIDNMKIA